MQGTNTVAVLDGSSFTSNSAQAGGSGGAVAMNAGSLYCRTCHFELNWVTGSGSGGGAVFMEGTNSVAVLDGSSFTSNSAPAGGAIFVLSGCSIPSLNQTSFVNNTAAGKAERSTWSSRQSSPGRTLALPCTQ